MKRHNALYGEGFESTKGPTPISRELALNFTRSSSKIVVAYGHCLDMTNTGE